MENNEMFEIITQGASILDTFTKTVPLNADNEIPHAAMSNIFEGFGELDQETFLRIAMAGLQHAYELQVKDAVIGDLKRERDEVKRDLEEAHRTMAEAHEQAKVEIESLETYVRDIEESV
jgi:hypothetical protein